MASRNRQKPPSQRPGRDNNRRVKVGIVADTPTHAFIGVMLETGPESNPDSRLILAPDDARTLADKESDPHIAKCLRGIADFVEQYQSKLPACSIIAPRIIGPEALQQWAERHRALIQSCYRTAIRAGWPGDVVLWVMPRTESLDDAPLSVGIFHSREARTLVKRQLPSLRGSLDDPPRPGYFYLIASKEEGRFKGSLIAMLPIPSDDELLPPSLVIETLETERN